MYPVLCDGADTLMPLRTDRSREIYQMGFDFFGQDEEGIDKSQSLYSSFAKMEVRLKEYDRARVIYKVSFANYAPLIRDQESDYFRCFRTVRSGSITSLAFNPTLRCLLQL